MLQGHNHSYQRTCPVHKGKCKKMGEAPVYVDVGNAGALLGDNPVHGSSYMKVHSSLLSPQSPSTLNCIVKCLITTIGEVLYAVLCRCGH